MKKMGAIALVLVCLIGLIGCTRTESVSDYPAAIMVDGRIYLYSANPMPVEVDESAIIGYTTSYIDTFPAKDGETNFSRELKMPYAKVEGGIAVLNDNEWHLCRPKD